MKTRFLQLMTLMVIVVCGIFVVNKVMAATCYDLDSGACTTTDKCYNRCTPSCSTGRSSYAVDKCDTVCSGYDTCEAHPTNEVDCYYDYDCIEGTSECSSDAAETTCTSDGETYETHTTSEKILSGSGCGS